MTTEPVAESSAAGPETAEDETPAAGEMLETSGAGRLEEEGDVAADPDHGRPWTASRRQMASDFLNAVDGFEFTNQLGRPIRRRRRSSYRRPA